MILEHGSVQFPESLWPGFMAFQHSIDFQLCSVEDEVIGSCLL